MKVCVVIVLLVWQYSKVLCQNVNEVGKPQILPLTDFADFKPILLANDSNSIADSDSIKIEEHKSKLYIRTTLDLFLTFNGIHFLNGKGSDGKSNLHFYYNFTVTNNIRSGNWSISSYFNCELGMKIHEDSISELSEDLFTFKNDLTYTLRDSKYALIVSFCTKSQFFSHYNYRFDSLNIIVRYLYSAYMSPGFFNYSGGFKYQINDHMIIEVGLVSSQKTKIRNQELYKTRMSESLYGIAKGEKMISEFGLTFTFNSLSHPIYKNVYWENFSQLNVNRQNHRLIKCYNLDINNAFHYRFLKYLRITLRTKVIYNHTISLKTKIVNTFTFGFYLNNQIK